MFSYLYQRFGKTVFNEVIDDLGGDIQIKKTITVDELHIYGSSRHGLYKPKRLITSKSYALDEINSEGGLTTVGTCLGCLPSPRQGITDKHPAFIAGATDSTIYKISYHFFSRTLTKKQYELSNHLGNVLASILDRKTANTNSDTLTYYSADVATAQYYYAYGSAISELSYAYSSAGDTMRYRFGFNGMEENVDISKDGDIYSLGFREYDARLGRMFTLDPRISEYQWQSPYVYHRNNPINYVDYMGGGDSSSATDKITSLMNKSGQENLLGIELNKQGDAKLMEGIGLLDQASTLLKGNYTDADVLEAIKLSELASKYFDEGASLYEEASRHAEMGENYYKQALALVPLMMEEYYAELDKLKQWRDEKKINIIINVVGEKLGLNGLVGVGVIEIFGPTLPKTPVFGSFPGTSRWSKYVASKFPLDVGKKIPGVNTTSITRGGGRIAVPLMLIWQAFETAESIHDLYQAYENGPTVEEIQFWLDDFEKWKKENPE